jgi:hypothetical protein
MLFKTLSKLMNGLADSVQNESPLRILTASGIKPLVNKQRIREALKQTREGNLRELNLNDDEAEAFFRGMFEDDNFPNGLAGDQGPLGKVFKEAGDKSPVTGDQAKQGLGLIKSGELFRDVAFTVTTLFGFVADPARFSEPGARFRQFGEGLVKLSTGVRSDLDPRLAFGRISKQMESIKSGQKPDDPELLRDTLKSIYGLPEIGDAIGAANALLQPDNESLRLALLVYARLNGINLTEEDIDKVRETILDRNNPDLGRLFRYAFDNKERFINA